MTDLDGLDPFAAALDALEPHHSGKFRGCTVGHAIESMAASRARSLIHAIAREEVAAPQIAELLNKFGHPIKAQAINRHRRRTRSDGTGCTCPADEVLLADLSED